MDGEAQGESGAVAGFARRGDGAVVAAHDFADQREAEAEAAAVAAAAAGEAFEDAFGVGGVEADAVVGDGEFEFAGGRDFAQGQRDHAIVAGVADGVVDQRGDDAAQSGGDAVHKVGPLFADDA